MGNTAETRRAQMFPILEPAEIERLERFGDRVQYAADTALATAGQTPPGVFVLIEGRVVVTRRDPAGIEQPVADQGPGEFIGELSQLAGRPSLVDARAVGEVEALLIRPERLRALMIAEVELGERVMRALILRRVGLIEAGAGPLIIGHAGQGDVLRLGVFLSRNGVPNQTLDPDQDPAARAMIERFHPAPEELPIVLCPGGEMLRNPSEQELGRCLGLVGPIDPDHLYDVAVVGAGPAGLATAVYAASEGLSVLVLDSRAFGGQAGASSRIENYLGFPTGITGMALMARAYNQAQKFGAELAIPDEVTELCDAVLRPHYRLRLGEMEEASARTVVVASGARYRRPAIEGIEDYEGTSVHYWASPLERRLCGGQEVVLVGGGNSAGQAAVYLAGEVGKVWMIVRREGLEATMSRYLVERIAALPNVELVTESELSRFEGSGGVLDAVTWRSRRTGAETRRPIGHVFLFIGADPNTGWLSECGISLDGHGFVRTGADVAADRLPLETSRRGVFAVGDARAGSVKRVAAAVGEGAQVVASIHAFLAAEAAASPPPATAVPERASSPA